jgi:hypothetical protein
VKRFVIHTGVLLYATVDHVAAITFLVAAGSAHRVCKWMSPQER